jgi:galactokinase
MDFINLFVPGCACLFGEHSDWVGELRRIDPSLPESYCLAVGTNQGFYATARKRAGGLLVKSALMEPGNAVPVEVPMETGALQELALAEHFFSPVAGVALEYLESGAAVGGLELFFYKSDLPVDRGFFSAEAAAVLTARAFRLCYGLPMGIEDEIERARSGQRRTGFPCGRIAHVAAAYGFRPVFVVFDGVDVAVQPIIPARPLYLVLADLGTQLDGICVQDMLRTQFQTGQGGLSENIRNGLTEVSSRSTLEARNSVLFADVSLLGKLMDEAQESFDRFIAPLSPELFEAPRLHALLESEAVRALSWGGKRLGTAPDGAAQLVARGPEEQRRLLQVLRDGNFSIASAHSLTIPGSRER